MSGELVHNCTDPQVVSLNGGVGYLMKNIQIEQGTPHQLPGVLNLGYVAASSLEAARAVAVAGTGNALLEALHNQDIKVVSGAAWAIQQICKHGQHGAFPMAEKGGIGELLKIYAKNRWLVLVHVLFISKRRTNQHPDSCCLAITFNSWP